MGTSFPGDAQLDRLIKAFNDGRARMNAAVKNGDTATGAKLLIGLRTPVVLSVTLRTWPSWTPAALAIAAARERASPIASVRGKRRDPSPRHRHRAKGRRRLVRGSPRDRRS